MEAGGGELEHIFELVSEFGGGGGGGEVLTSKVSDAKN